RVVEGTADTGSDRRLRGPATRAAATVVTVPRAVRRLRGMATGDTGGRRKGRQRTGPTTGLLARRLGRPARRTEPARGPAPAGGAQPPRRPCRIHRRRK